LENVIECVHLTHYFGKKLVFQDINYQVKAGSTFGLLGKNGAGKTTTINILNGYLTPSSGQCLIFGEDSQHLSPPTKQKIGYLMEGHIQFGFMNIQQIEKFYAPFYPHWKREAYFDLMAKLNVSPKQKISKMSCGQRSQVALGLVLAQDPDLMVLDDYSMGLDPGYRRLFIDYLKAYTQSENKTIFVTSHIIQDLQGFIDEAVIMGCSGILYQGSVKNFHRKFRCYQFTAPHFPVQPPKNEIIHNLESIRGDITLYSFRTSEEVQAFLKGQGIEYSRFRDTPMSLEDAFIGLTGKY
jgi:ABC-2 type transport system ATP-binding protein